MNAAVFVFYSAILVPFSAYAAETAEQQWETQISRPASHLEERINVTGDNLDPFISVDTKDVTVFQKKILLTAQTIETSFLRATIDRKTKSVSSQIYHIATYPGRSWASFYLASYESTSGLQQVDAISIDTDVSCSRYLCSHEEHIGVPISFSELEAFALMAAGQEKPGSMHYRLFGRSGLKVDDAVPANEIIAFVSVVNRLRHTNQPSE